MRFGAIAFAACTMLSTMASAQSVRPETIKDDAIGWMRVYNFPAAPKPVVVDHRTYSIAQLSIANQIANWLQASFMPTGALGDAVRSVSEKLSPYNQYTASLPQSYGAYAKLYTDLKYDAARKIVPATNSNVVFSILANGFVGEVALDLSSAERIYFTLPPFALQGGEAGKVLEKTADVSAHPVLGKYPRFFQRNSVNGNRQWVFLTRDYRLPYTTVTRGEYIMAMQAAVMRRYAEEKKKLDGDANRKYAEIAIKNLERDHAARLAMLKTATEKYKGRVNEPAEISTDQPSSLLNYADVFEGTGNSGYSLPVYTIDPAVAERAKSEQPLWILVGWTARDGRDPVLDHLQEAVTTRFNFEYLHNYFFAPEKVKGQAYSPLPKR